MRVARCVERDLFTNAFVLLVFFVVPLVYALIARTPEASRLRGGVPPGVAAISQS